MTAEFLGALPRQTGPEICCRFRWEGRSICRPVAAGNGFPLMNRLQIGRRFRLTPERGAVVDVEPCEELPPFPAEGRTVPGGRTLKALLAAAAAPLGRVLYVYGGGWDWQDSGAGPQTRSPAPAPEWHAFFQAQDGRYSYRDHRQSGGRNPWYFAGLDCSGYLGWAVYAALYDRAGLTGLVCPAQRMAGELATRGWGALLPAPESFRPGDICSIRGHVWLCMGTCGDGSVLLAHSTPSPSREGCPGGGVQLSALSPDGSGGEALALADAVMRRRPAWYRRYAPIAEPWDVYTGLAGGVFRWALDGSGPLTDPEDCASRSAPEVLALLGLTDG